MNFEKFLSFSRLLNSFAKIERVVEMPGTGRNENDVEHSYHLALMGWYIIASQKLNLDVSKVLKYALAHDLVEVHAGDTWIWSKDEKDHESKQEREAAAAIKLQEDFSEFAELHEAIAAYENREDQESKFVYALDKVLPCILLREEGGKQWQECGITLEMLESKKNPQVALSPQIEPYFKELVELIRKEKITAGA